MKEVDKNKKVKPPKPKKKPRKKLSPEEKAVTRILNLVNKLGKKTGTKVFPFLLMPMELGRDLVETTYEMLNRNFKDVVDLDVLVTSAGGDIHSAYHLARLLQRYATGKLRFIVPRYAKSAATVLIFGGDEIVFGPTSEMGPLDPQIALPDQQIGKLIQRFSPLAIRPALDLIAEENEKGHKILVEKLSASLPDALLLGQHLKALEVAKYYVLKLLTTRMLKDREDAQAVAENIGERLVSSYPDHSCCIDYDEAVALGLNVVMAPEDEWNIIWDIWKHAQDYMRQQAEATEKAEQAKHDILDMA